MTSKEFLNKLANGKEDVLQVFLDLLKKHDTACCIIGGLAVNAYAEPVVSLDMDVIIVSDKMDALLKALKKRFTVETFPNSIKLNLKGSDLRIQVQTDPRYQNFLSGASVKTVLGYKIPVARIEDVIQGKIWAATDPKRRPSKRQKDLADIMRLIEIKPKLKALLPEPLSRQLYPG